MATNLQSAVIGVFRDRALAEQAVQALKEHGWIEDVRLVERSAHGVLDTLRDMWTPHEATTEQIPTELDLPGDQRQLYERELERGSCILLVHALNHLLETRETLNHYGAYHVYLPLQLGGVQTIPVCQEVPHVQKQVVDVGEIRIHKRVITEERTFTVPVTREEVTIERIPRTSTPQSSVQEVPLDDTTESASLRPGDSSAASSLPDEVLREDGMLRILVREEQVLIQKQPVVIEEIVVRKQTVEEVRHLVEPIRHEEVRVEQIGRAPVYEQRNESASPADSSYDPM